MSCEHCLNRREFLTKSAAVTAAVAATAMVSGCGNGVFGPPLPHGGSHVTGPLQIRVADFPDLATPGTLTKVATERAAMRIDATTFFAMSLVCTHQGCEANVIHNLVACPCHGSRYDDHGNVLNGPATKPLQVLTATYDAQTDELTIV